MYLNDFGYKVPENKILIVPHNVYSETHHEKIILPLKGEIKRDWFNSHFYYCLPLNIGNQYGFAIKSLRNFDVEVTEKSESADITFLDNENSDKQNIDNHFGSGIITIQNHFSLKTPPGVNIMTIQPPNLFIEGLHVMTGVIETDQIKRDFTFNIKVSSPNKKISIRNGDIIAGFLPIPRGFVDNFTVEPALSLFDQKIIQNEIDEANRLGVERSGEDRKKPHGAGRRYFNGINTDGSKYPDHQKRLN
jgi:hypothetical protein